MLIKTKSETCAGTGKTTPYKIGTFNCQSDFAKLQYG